LTTIGKKIIRNFQREDRRRKGEQEEQERERRAGREDR
jgi:hypothetical protein